MSNPVAARTFHVACAHCAEMKAEPPATALDVERLRRCSSLMAILNRLGKFNDAWWNRLADEYAAAYATPDAER